MAYQFNLCPETFQPKRQVFGARTMLISLLVLLVAGAATAAVWRWSLEQQRLVFQQQTAQQTSELTQLKALIAQMRASQAPVDAKLMQQAQAQRMALTQRENLLSAVREGVFMPGEGHSDRLRMLASSIPSAIWVTSVKAELGRMEVSGFTLESGALNEWVSRLSTHALMRDLKLSTVAVENKTEALVQQAASRPARSAVPLWSFNLVNVEPARAAVGATPQAPAGSVVPGNKP